MKKQGYTLTEVLIASAVAVLVIGGVTSSMAHVIRTWRETQVEAELNMNLELAMEYMRQDLRLSSVGIGLMSFYPATERRYTAVSFPIAEDSDGDGMLDRGADGRILWTKTVIYHVLAISPNEFRRTLFSPRSSSATPRQLYDQLEQVAKAHDANQIQNAALTGETSNSRPIFKNLTHVEFYPPKSMFDGYSATRKHGSTFNFGSVILAPGPHTLTFAVQGKNDDSSGYNIEVDKFRLGRARGALEGEIYLPQNSHPKSPLFSFNTSGGTLSAEDMSSHGIEWSGNAQAKFTADGIGSEVNFTVGNDMWCDSNFDEPGSQISSNCSVKWDTSLASIAPYMGDKVVTMDKGIAWSAAACGDTPYVLVVSKATRVTSIVYGNQARDDMAISLNGCWTKLHFERPDGYSLNLSDVELYDLDTGEKEDVTFNNGGNAISVPTSGDSIIESDWVPLWEIDRQKSYAISFKSAPQGPGVWGLAGWLNSDGVNLSTVDGTNVAFTTGIHALEVGYPKKAIYRSGVFDTHTDTPTFTSLYWTHIERFSEGGDIDIRVRSATTPDMADGSWLATYPIYDGYFQSNSGNFLFRMPHRRYIQYEALFSCGFSGRTQAHTNAPTAILRDVSILWNPPMGLVDLEVDFGTGPDCGIVEATVDGQDLAKSLVVELAIFKQGPRRVQTVRARTEVRPLNTGK
jgi:type II secretory pathway pseudopilin PulG